MHLMLNINWEERMTLLDSLAEYAREKGKSPLREMHQRRDLAENLYELIRGQTEQIFSK